jgi:GNAT superfamily N-acetyltransferase
MVLPLRDAHLPAVIPLLTEAFVSDAGMRALCSGTTEAHAWHCLTAWFRATVGLHLATSQPAWVVSVDDMIVGVALLTQPNGRGAPHAWLHWVVEVGTHCGWGTVWRTARHEHQRAVYRPPQAHMVLEFIAIHEAYRGQGYAAVLLDVAQQWSTTRAVSAGIWLETTRLRNIAFFEHFGYVVTGQMALAQGAALFLFRAND